MPGEAQAVVGDVAVLFRLGRLGELPDGPLLERFLEGGDAARPAFEGLVARHGPMVRGVCLRVLGDRHEADDAFQATFLVLALRAGSIRKPGALGPWLHGVAARVARRARDSARRRRESQPVCPRIEPATGDPDPAESNELRAVLDEELGRLREAYRRPLVLCYLEGLSQEQAARVLGWSKGTVSGRLARAKELLRGRLARRGLAPASAIAALLARPAEAASMPPPSLAAATVQAAAAASLGGAEALGVPAAVRTLSDQAVRTLRLASLRATASVLLPALVLGGVALALAAPRGGEGPRPSNPTPTPEPPRPKATAPVDPPQDEPPPPKARPELARPVAEAVANAVTYLKREQKDDGSWVEVDQRSKTGTTALVTLALLAAGERADSPAVSRALDYLDRFTALDLGRTYPVALQTRVFAEADPRRFRWQVERNVAWLSKAQIKPGDHNPNWPGAWTYDADKATPADNSNTHYALLALDAARRAGVRVDPEVWRLARDYWRTAQRPDGTWGYMPQGADQPTASMTCAGICGLAIAHDALGEPGEASADPDLRRALDALAAQFRVAENFGKGQLWKFYYLDALGNAAHLAQVRRIGEHDWYREGSDHLLANVAGELLPGGWVGTQATEREPLVATSFAALFLAGGGVWGGD
jgi:RNA polymerase sigma-70 factor (ECF subfamily)